MKYLECIGEEICTQSVVISSIPTEHPSAQATETLCVEDSVPELAGEGVVTVVWGFLRKKRWLQSERALAAKGIIREL